MRAAIDLDFSIHSPLAGAQFSVGAVIKDDDGLAILLDVQNTGEQGRLTLVLDGTRAWGFNYDQARTWRAAFPGYRAKGGALGTAVQRFSDKKLLLAPIEGGGLPITLNVGERWQGWLATLREADCRRVIALLVILGPMGRERVAGSIAIPAVSATQPFMSLVGEANVQPIAGLSLLFTRTKIALRRTLLSMVRLPLEAVAGGAGAIVGVSVGSLVYRPLEIPLGLIGIVAARLLLQLWRWYRLAPTR